MAIRKSLTAVLLFVLIMIPAHGSSGETATVFAPGEKLTFELKWGIFPAGTAEVEVLPMEMIDGKPVYHFVMRTRTNSFLDAFYRVRIRIDAYADLNNTRSIKYVKNTEVRKDYKEVIVTFDWQRNQAHYRRTCIDNAEFDNPIVDEKTIDLIPNSLDPLSAFYYSRTVLLNGKRRVEWPVTDGKKSVMARATVLKRQKLEVNRKKYDTFLILPDLQHVSGVFDKSKDAKVFIWVTADEHRIPIKLKSAVAVGSFTGELVSIERPKGDDSKMAALPSETSSRIP